MAKCNIAGVDDCNDGWPCITIDQSDKKSGLVAPNVEEPVACAPVAGIGVKVELNSAGCERIERALL